MYIEGSNVSNLLALAATSSAAEKEEEVEEELADVGVDEERMISVAFTK